MNSTQYLLLKSILEEPAYISLNDSDAADAINVPNITLATAVPTIDIQEILTNSGDMSKIVDLYNDANPTDSVVGVYHLMSANNKLDGVDLSNPPVLSYFTTLQTDSVITQAVLDAITDGSSKSISRAEQEGLPVIKLGHIKHARNL